MLICPFRILCSAGTKSQSILVMCTSWLLCLDSSKQFTYMYIIQYYLLFIMCVHIKEHSFAIATLFSPFFMSTAVCNPRCFQRQQCLWPGVCGGCIEGYMGHNCQIRKYSFVGENFLSLSSCLILCSMLFPEYWGLYIATCDHWWRFPYTTALPLRYGWKVAKSSSVSKLLENVFTLESMSLLLKIEKNKRIYVTFFTCSLVDLRSKAKSQNRITYTGRRENYKTIKQKLETVYGHKYTMCTAHTLPIRQKRLFNSTLTWCCCFCNLTNLLRGQRWLCVCRVTGRPASSNS